MLEYERIDISEGIDTNKTSASKECNICHYWYFLDKSFNYNQRNREVILNRAKYYYENNKELLRERPKDKYRELSEEENNIKREYGKKDIKTCLKKIKKKSLKNIKKIIARLKNMLHKRKYINKSVLQRYFLFVLLLNFK